MSAGRIPGPPAWTAPANLLRFRREAPRFYQRLSARYGPLVRIPMGLFRAHLLNDPQGIEYVLRNDGPNFRKGVGNDVLEPLIGSGLFLAEGEPWQRTRKMVQPLFTTANVDRLGPLTRARADEMAESWAAAADDGDPVPVHAHLRELTLRVLATGLVGSDLFEERGALRADLDVLFDRVNDSLLSLTAGLRFGRRADSRRRLARLNAELEGVIRERAERATVDDEAPTLLDLLLAARSRKDGGGLEPAAVRDEVMTFLLAGQECTSIAVAWTLYLLAMHPEEQTRVHEGNLAGDPTRLRMALDESLRLYPPAWILSRQCNSEEEICGHALPRDAIVQISPWVTHRDPRFWDEPERFDPERFAPGAEHRPFVYFPFGSGPRLCVGRPLALMMARTILEVLLRRYAFTAMPGPPPAPDHRLTLRPRRGILLLLGARN